MSKAARRYAILNSVALMATLVINNQATPRLLNVVEPDPSNAVANPKLYLYDVIDEYWGISAKSVVNALAEIDDSREIDVHINSPGGSVFEARAIISTLRQRAGGFNTFVDGVAASAASWIATAGKKSTMAKGSFLMIHPSMGMAIGNAVEMRSLADVLEKIDKSIVDEYVAKTGLERNAILEWFNKETWFTDSEAVENKFIDGIAGDAVGNKWNMAGAFNNVPEALTQTASDEDGFDWAMFNRRAEALILGA